MPNKRVLCLHGYHGRASLVLSQLAPLFDEHADRLDLVAYDAPSIAAGDFGWWHGKFALWDEPFSGWDRTVDWVRALFAREHFDGLIGMSQGAALTGLLTGMRAPDGVPTETHPVTFDWAVMIGGFVSDEPEHRPLYQSRESYAGLPSLHIMGRTDTVVPIPDSQRLAACFKDATIAEHGGGHVVPRSVPIKKAVTNFLDRVVDSEG